MARRLEEEDRARVETGENGLLFRYKGLVPIPSLGLMDDNLTISEAGYKAEVVNTFMNENSAEKHLQFNAKKFKFMKIGKNKLSSLPQSLKVDSWNKEYDEEENLIESEGSKINMNEVKDIKYLGFVISNDGSNVANILDKQEKSISIIKSITNMKKGPGYIHR